MTYIAGGLNQATIFNEFADTNSPNVNAIWSTGASNSGYGQTTISTVTQNQIITASNWSSLLGAVTSSASHQGTSIASFLNSTPAAGNLVRYESNLAGNITLINTNRLNAAAQGSTSTNTATSVSTWTVSSTARFIIVFASNNAARYFFNAGGQFSISCSHPNTSGSPINTVLNQMASGLGTIWLSSPTSGTATLSGISYSGVSRIGGGGFGTFTSQPNRGFYALIPTYQELAKNQYTGSPYTNTYISVSAKYNGTGTLTIDVLWDEVPDGATVNAGSITTLTTRPPSTTYLSNSWGTPSITPSVTSI